MDFGAIKEVFGIAAVVLGSTWHLSAKISSISGEVKSTREMLDRHIAEDERECERLERKLDGLRLRQRA